MSQSKSTLAISSLMQINLQNSSLNNITFPREGAGKAEESANKILQNNYWEHFKIAPDAFMHRSISICAARFPSRVPHTLAPRWEWFVFLVQEIAFLRQGFQGRKEKGGK